MDVLASSAEAWRAWLRTHGGSETEVWLVIHHKDSVMPSLRYGAAVEHALCYGWIDGLHRKHGADSSRLRFTPRRPQSTWSAVNRERASRMIAQGLMTAAGQAAIDLAKNHGTWQPTPNGIPSELQELLDKDSVARANFVAFPTSSQHLIREWIAAAKRPQTRKRRVARTVELAATNRRANHPDPHKKISAVATACCRKFGGGSVPGVRVATRAALLQRRAAMKYLLLKHYRGAPAPVVDVPMDQWTPEEVDAHVQFMRDFAARLEETGEFVDAQALAPEGAFVRYDGAGRPPVTDGPFPETKDLIAGWMVIDVESWDRAVELAGELSAAPGAGGKAIHEWLEVRPFLNEIPMVTE